MELIATARFKKAMDRAAAATTTPTITKIVRDLAKSGLEVSHPLLQPHQSDPRRVDMLMLTSNRGLCGGYNGSVIRAAMLARNQRASGPGTCSLRSAASVAFQR
jgi:F-type H+-transporting ATPase subunit gamma